MDVELRRHWGQGRKTLASTGLSAGEKQPEQRGAQRTAPAPALFPEPEVVGPSQTWEVPVSGTAAEAAPALPGLREQSSCKCSRPVPCPNAPRGPPGEAVPGQKAAQQAPVSHVPRDLGQNV